VKGLNQGKTNSNKLAARASGAYQRAISGAFHTTENNANAKEIAIINKRKQEFEEAFSKIDMKATMLKLNEELNILKKAIPVGDSNNIEAMSKKTLSHIKDVLNKYRAYFNRDKNLSYKLTVAIQKASKEGSVSGIEDPMLKEMVSFFVPLIALMLPTIGRIYNTDPKMINELQAAFMLLSTSIKGGKQSGGEYNDLEALKREKNKSILEERDLLYKISGEASILEIYIS
jgi:hypothetical protein